MPFKNIKTLRALGRGFLLELSKWRAVWRQKEIEVKRNQLHLSKLSLEQTQKERSLLKLGGRLLKIVGDEDKQEQESINEVLEEVVAAQEALEKKIKEQELELEKLEQEASKKEKAESKSIVAILVKLPKEDLKKIFPRLGKLFLELLQSDENSNNKKIEVEFYQDILTVINDNQKSSEYFPNTAENVEGRIKFLKVDFEVILQAWLLVLKPFKEELKAVNINMPLFLESLKNLPDSLKSEEKNGCSKVVLTFIINVFVVAIKEIDKGKSDSCVEIISKGNKIGDYLTGYTYKAKKLFAHLVEIDKALVIDIKTLENWPSDSTEICLPSLHIFEKSAFNLLKQKFKQKEGDGVYRALRFDHGAELENSDLKRLEEISEFLIGIDLSGVNTNEMVFDRVMGIFKKSKLRRIIVNEFISYSENNGGYLKKKNKFLEELGLLKSASELHLQFSGLDDENVNRLKKNFTKDNKLKTLVLCGNIFTRVGLKDIALLVARLLGLEKLDLEDNDYLSLEGGCCACVEFESLFEKILQVGKLQSLDLSQPNINYDSSSSDPGVGSNEDEDEDEDEDKNEGDSSNSENNSSIDKNKKYKFDGETEELICKFLADPRCPLKEFRMTLKKDSALNLSASMQKIFLALKQNSRIEKLDFTGVEILDEDGCLLVELLELRKNITEFACDFSQLTEDLKNTILFQLEVNVFENCPAPAWNLSVAVSNPIAKKIIWILQNKRFVTAIKMVAAKSLSEELKNEIGFQITVNIANQLPKALLDLSIFTVTDLMAEKLLELLKEKSSITHITWGKHVLSEKTMAEVNSRLNKNKEIEDHARFKKILFFANKVQPKKLNLAEIHVVSSMGDGLINFLETTTSVVKINFGSHSLTDETMNRIRFQLEINQENKKSAKNSAVTYGDIAKSLGWKTPETELGIKPEIKDLPQSPTDKHKQTTPVNDAPGGQPEDDKRMEFLPIDYLSMEDEEQGQEQKLVQV